MEGLSPLVMEVYNKDFVYQGMISRPQTVSLVPRHNGVGTGAFTLDSDDDAVEALTAPGARVVVKYRHDPDDLHSPMHLLSGSVQKYDMAGVLAAPTRVFAVTGDWDVLNKFTCRAVPGSGWGSQGTADTYYSTSGAAETVIKTIVSANLSINPFGITVAATHGWGETIAVQLRNNILTDKIFPALNYAHVGISVRQVGSGLTLDGYLPTVHTAPLTVESGIVAKADGSIIRPTVSRVPVRGSDGVVREVVNTALEATYGFVGWAPVLDISESNTASYLDAKGWEVLNAGAAQAEAAIELAETDDWRFGLAFNLGDEVTVEMPGGGSIPDVIREAEFTYGVDSGLVIAPRVGESSASPNQTLIKAVHQVAARQRITQARG